MLASQNAAFMRPDPSSHIVMLYNMRMVRDPHLHPNFFPSFHFPVQVSCSNQTFWNVDAPGYTDRGLPMTVNATHFAEILSAVGVIE
jgi:hypothetical protein